MSHVAKVFALAVGVTLGLGAAQAGQAATGHEQTSVQFGDLDLHSQAGAERVIARLQAGADKVCGERPGLRDVARSGEYRQCVRHAMGDAVAQLNSPLVSALYGKESEQVALGK